MNYPAIVAIVGVLLLTVSVSLLITLPPPFGARNPKQPAPSFNFDHYRAILSDTFAPANENMPALTVNQCAVLCEMGSQDEIARPASHLALRTGLHVSTVSLVRQQLRSLGLAEYGPLFDDEQNICGRGYWLTCEGVEAKARLLSDKEKAA